MKKIITAAILAALTLTSCGHDLPDETVKTPDEIPTATTSEAEFENDASYYTGTFNAEVFWHIVCNINIGGNWIAVPCTLSDMGKGFEAGYIYCDKKSETVSYSLTYEGSDVGRIFYRGDGELTESELAEKAFFSLDIDLGIGAPEPTEVAGLTVGAFGGTVGSGRDDIVERLGEPTEELSENNKVTMRYKTDKDILAFTLCDNELKLVSIEFGGSTEE